jgi:ATP sulfurylase
MKREWFTIAFFDSRNQPHPAHRENNFIRIETTESDMIDSFVESAHEGRFWGADFVAVWPGKLSAQTAMSEDRYPTFYIHADGRVERFAPREPNLYHMVKRAVPKSHSPKAYNQTVRRWA